MGATLTSLRPRADFPVALVTMPFGPAHAPCIQIALLASVVRAAGFPARTLHLDLELVREIGTAEYQAIGLARGHLLGEWLFARAAHGDAPPADDEYLDRLDRARGAADAEPIPMARARLLEIKNEIVPRYLDGLLEQVPWGDFAVVGFTSTFQQNNASLALATALKRRYPDLTTVFGGAGFEVEMGLEFTRAFSCIDAAVIGEGEVTLVELLDALRERRDPASVPGVVVRRHGGEVTKLQLRPPRASLDDLPTPDYGEYFERAGRLGLSAEGVSVPIPYETSRGCWWGQKHLCTFCGLNLHDAGYRSKSPERILAEIDELCQRHPGIHLVAADNIVDYRYFRTLFPALAARASTPPLFLEVKANLTRAQLELLRQAGVVGLQPGIESLSSHVLQLMRKGSTAIQNVNTMRWARALGIEVMWNLLWGFPGETGADYASLAELLPLLHHLQPPQTWGRLKLMRFSPLFVERSRFPATVLRPDPAYTYVYPPCVALEEVAFVFEHEFVEALPDDAYVTTQRALEDWSAAWQAAERPTLLFWTFPGFVRIEDARRPAERAVHTLEGLAGRVYAACAERGRAPGALAEALDAPEPEVERVLEDLVARGLTLRDGAAYLSLAIPSTRPRMVSRAGRVFISQTTDG